MRIGILGAGVVGSSVAELAEEYGHTVTAIADSKSATTDANGIDVEAVLERKKNDGVVGDEPSDSAIDASYDALIEATPITIGDAEPAFSHVKGALERDCHVVLGNKGPMAQRYRDVRALEAESDGEIRFEATVGGPMPVLSTISDLGPDHVTRVRGVFNSLANFILSRMTAEGLGYEHVLAEAQDLGVAEVDPTFDVEGTDAALTCSILANVLTQSEREFTIDDVHVEGIKEIPGSALDLAKDDGRTVRLIGEISEDDVRVAPRLVSENSALAVSGARTVIQLETEHAGQTHVTGAGATGHEIATAILVDVTRLEAP
ncbi:homoserine dehydrogenase [Halorarum halophilum]|uniref:homoserine dehydrogenase n=1 Tax=Halorarum halophilum TaxID=2743090 RepID=A0A7D5KN24_9EURY|nr:2-dehydropantoate 2-reductase N-terminal domain-containing protein [Halobaculum halophilum]QLG28935.1 homoserine dehydrogenase [Halobaculum halophilum]